MNKLLTIALLVGASFLCLVSTHAQAEEQQSFTQCLANPENGFDQCVDQAVAPISNAIASTIFYAIPITEDIQIRWIVIWLIFGALFFTLYLRFIPLWGFKHALELVRGKYYDPKSPGEVSHFQALTTALSGTVGLGNIAGVAVAITLGGPGATFWMILAGLLGMSSKFAECTLGVKYRMHHADGSVSGGPNYYLTTGLAERGWPALGRVLAVFFAICCIGASIGAGNMFQANQAFAMSVQASGGEGSFLADKGWLFGLVISALVGIVIIGGIRSIARVTSKLVPFMAIIYVVTAIIILLSHATEIPSAFGLIFKGAFSAEGVVGGAVGAMIQGFQRAGFSNEAGIGSAAIAHSAVKTNEPATEGFVALLEPFIDTVVICTMTALVIIITGSLNTQADLSGVELTAFAFTSVLPWFEWILATAVVLFAFSTMLTWSYYGSISWEFLFGRSQAAAYSYKLLFCAFVVLGAMASLDNVINFSDSMIFAMSLANLVGLYFLAPVIKQEVSGYRARLNANN